jgi:hypothetical protein
VIARERVCEQNTLGLLDLRLIDLNGGPSASAGVTPARPGYWLSMGSTDRQIGERSAAVGHLHGHALIEMAPSPAPARQLADLLWDSRRGYDFETAFKEDSELAWDISLGAAPRPS